MKGLGMMKKISRILLITVITVLAISLGACSTLDETGNADGSSALKVLNKASTVKEAVLTIGYLVEYVYTSPNDLYNNSDLVVVATYGGDVRSYADPYFGHPQTISKATVSEVLKGELETNTTINVLYRGGRITLEEYIKAIPPEQRKYYESTYTEKEMKSHYVEDDAMNAPSLSFENGGQKYLMFLKYIEEDAVYVVQSDGFGALKIADNGQVYSPSDNRYVTLDFYRG